MKTKLNIIKIGGNIIDNETTLSNFLKDFANLNGPKILVHGGGKMASALNEKLGIKTKMNEGRRITSSDNLEVVSMVYAGLINKKVVAKLQAFNCNAMGLSGADGNSISAIKRPAEPIDFGWVGDVKTVNLKIIEMLLKNDIYPVFCALSHDENGQLLNTNADTIAAEIAIEMSQIYDTTLKYCFEKDGVLLDVNNSKSTISTVDSKLYRELKSKRLINDGMLPKLENCFHALKNKVSTVTIGSAAINDSNKCTQIIY